MNSQERIDAAWREVVQTKANCDAALADKRWREASHWAYELKRAACALEDAIDAHAPQAVAPALR